MPRDGVTNVEVSCGLRVATCVLLMVSVCLFSPAGVDGQDEFRVSVPQQVYHVEERGTLSVTVSYTAPWPPASLYVDVRTTQLNLIFKQSPKEDLPFVHQLLRDRLTLQWHTTPGWVQFNISNMKLEDSDTFYVQVLSDERLANTTFELNVYPLGGKPSLAPSGLHPSLALVMTVFVLILLK